jgi:hypothetical protein
VDVSGGVCDLLGVVEDMEHNWLLQRWKKGGWGQGE